MNQCLTDEFIRNEIRDSTQLLDDGNISNLGISNDINDINDNQQPNIDTASSEENISDEPPQVASGTSNSENLAFNDQSLSEPFVESGGDAAVDEQSFFDPFTEIDNTLLANEPSDTADWLNGNGIVDDSSKIAAVPSGSCDTNSHQNIHPRQTSEGTCSIRQPIEKMLDENGNSVTQPPNTNTEIKVHVARPKLKTKPAENTKCATGSIGALPIGVCASSKPHMVVLSNYQHGRVQFWRLIDADLGMALSDSFQTLGTN